MSEADITTRVLVEEDLIPDDRDAALLFGRCRHLNVGCGPYLAPRPWWNVDFAPNGAEADEVADVRELSYEDDRWERVYAGHVLEHLEPGDVVAAIREMRRVSTGEILLVGPDVELGAAMLVRGEIDETLFATLGAHGHDEEGNQIPPRAGCAHDHHWDSHMEAVCGFVVEAGLFPERLRIVDVPLDWPVVSRVRWQFACRIGAKG